MGCGCVEMGGGGVIDNYNLRIRACAIEIVIAKEASAGDFGSKIVAILKDYYPEQPNAEDQKPLQFFCNIPEHQPKEVQP